MIFVTYPLQFFVAVDTIRPILEDRFDSKNVVTAEYVIRIALVMFTCKYSYRIIFGMSTKCPIVWGFELT